MVLGLGPPGNTANTATRLSSPLSLPGGMRFEVVSPTVRPHRSLSSARAAAAAIAGVKSPVPEVRFASYTSSAGPLAANGQLLSRINHRPVWLVRYRAVPRLRATAIPARQKHAPTTISRQVLVDIVVVVDDATGDVLLRSELLATPDATGGDSLL